MSSDSVRRHSTIEPPHLTREQRIKMRDEIALRVLPYCCMEANKGDGSLRDKAKDACERAYVIADQMLETRSFLS